MSNIDIYGSNVTIINRHLEAVKQQTVQVVNTEIPAAVASC